MGTREITLTVNDHQHRLMVEDRKLLLDALREDLGLRGAHAGCEHGVCGACTILLDGQPARSCLMLAAQAEGRAVHTVESLANGNALHPLQRSFVENLGLQCGFCTSGMLLTARALLESNPSPTEEEVRAAISGNLCRCTGYTNIISAIKSQIEG